jgi:hypothetical protein
MSFEPTDSSVRIPLSSKESLASLDARVWFLGCGLGWATGLGLLCAFIAIWQKQIVTIAIPALLIALLHASIITVLWVYRFAMHRRTAMMASMLSSSILTVVLASLVASGGMATSPLYGLAFMQLVLAFLHPAVLASTTETESQSHAPETSETSEATGQ